MTRLSLVRASSRRRPHSGLHRQDADTTRSRARRQLASLLHRAVEEGQRASTGPEHVTDYALMARIEASLLAAKQGRCFKCGGTKYLLNDDSLCTTCGEPSEPSCIECGEPSPTRLCARCYVWDKL